METLNDYNLESNKSLVTVDFSDDNEWLELRRKGIGGSDIGAIMGLNPHSSPLKVYRQKVDGISEDLSDNVFIKKGKELEAVIMTNHVQPHFEKLGLKVGKPHFMIINSNYPYFRANVDGIAYADGTDYKSNIIVEIKWVSEWAEKNWYKPEYCGIPASYYAQVQLYMLVTGAQEAIVCALFDKDWEMNYFNVPRDEAFIKNMIEVGSYFYQYHMLMKMPPRLSYEVDKDEVTTAIKKAPTTLSPSDEMTTYIEKYLSNGEKIKKAEEIQSQLKDLILDLATKGYCPSDGKHSAKISVIKTNRLSSTKVKESYPEIYEQCCEESESPRLTIK